MESPTRLSPKLSLERSIGIDRSVSSTSEFIELEPIRAQWRALADRVADLCELAVPDFTSILWKGSTTKRWEGPFDFLPGISDLDIHVYRDGPVPHAEAAVATITATIGPLPFGCPLQVLILDRTTLRAGWMLLPGSYRLLRGRDPGIRLPSHASMVADSRRRLGEAGMISREIEQTRQRLVGHWVWPLTVRHSSVFSAMLPNALVEFGGLDPLKVWRLNRTRLLETARDVPAVDGLRRATIGYLEAALRAGPVGGAGDTADRALDAGLAVLAEAARLVREGAAALR